MRYAIWNDGVAVDVEAIVAPRDADEVALQVHRARQEGKHLKAVGAGHSFNDLALNEDVLIDLKHLNRLLSVDFEGRTVRVQAGMPLRVLVVILERMGLALPNIGAWTEQTIAGVLSTATHGTAGRYRKTLIEGCVELRLVDGLGELRVLRGEDLRYLTLGYFGIITEVVLRCEPLFWVRRSNFVRAGEAAIAGLPAELLAHDFVDLRWVGSIPRIIVRRWDVVFDTPTLLDRAGRLYEGTRLGVLNGFLSMLRASALPQHAGDRIFSALGTVYVGRGRGIGHTSVWHQGLTFNSLGIAAPHEEREFAVPMARAAECLTVLRALMLRDPAASGIEVQVRFSPAVDIVLAPNSGRDTMWFNLNIMNPARSAELVERVSQAVYEFGARPHWAKIIPACTPKLSELYGDDVLRWEARRQAYDPDGLFLNDWYHRYLGYAARTLREQDEARVLH